MSDDDVVYPQRSEELGWDLRAAGLSAGLPIVFDGGDAFDTVARSQSERAVMVAGATSSPAPSSCPSNCPGVPEPAGRARPWQRRGRCGRFPSSWI